MKFPLYLWLILTIVSCNEPSSKEVSHSKSKKKILFDFDLLMGDWKRTNDSGNKKTFESWWRDENGIPVGVGYTMVDSDTIWSESISIRKDKNAQSLVIKDKSGQETLFKIISESEKGFKCHNPNNEFPKFIEYLVEKDRIKAIISDDKNNIDFLFDRITNED